MLRKHLPGLAILYFPDFILHVLTNAHKIQRQNRKSALHTFSLCQGSWISGDKSLAKLELVVVSFKKFQVTGFQEG